MRRVAHLLAVSPLLVLLPAGCSPPGENDPGGTGARANPDTASPYVAAGSPVDAGAYLVQVAGCNDCHTPGYLQQEGDVPRDRWLTGLEIGFRGPWGTTYPDNLRWTVRRMSEEQWVTTMKTRSQQPPMPWFNLHAMSERDLRAIYRFIGTLGPPGDSVPENLPPGAEPRTPYYPFVPQPPEGSGAAGS